MEELLSTEVLDREILEDARKKAQRILKTAEDTMLANTAEWEKKKAESASELEKKYNEQRKLAAEKVMVRLPIDKQRAKIEKIENLLQDAVEFWYKSLNREQILKLLSKEISKRLIICEEFSAAKKKYMFYHGLNHKEAETVLKNIKENCIIEEKKSTSHYPLITLETDNVRITASIENVIDYLLHDKRDELITALLGHCFKKGEV